MTISDEVENALARDEIMTARLAFLDYVKVATGGVMFWTNYYDQVINGAIKAVAGTPPSSERVDKIVKLIELYCAFIDTLIPYQPDRKDFQGLGDLEGKVYYYVPQSGGYWVDGSRKYREMLETIRNAK
jgi:hypothetical protein